APLAELQSGGGTRGTTYNLLLEVAKRLEVPLKLRKVVFHEFFDRKGSFPEQVKTDPALTYRPDLLDQVDLYADMLTPVDWRKKLLSFVSVYPSKLVWIALKNGVKGPSPGTKVAVLSHSSYEDWIRAQPIKNEDLILTA